MLTHTLDWDLEEIQMNGKPIVFDRVEWSRAYKEWMRVLNKEPVEPQK